MTTSRINVGSDMNHSVSHGERISRYPRPSGLDEAARRLRTTRGTVKQMCWGAASVFNRAAVILECLTQAGQGAVAAGLKQPLDAACLPPVRESIPELCAEETALSGQENDAEMDLLLHPSGAAEHTYRKRLIRYRAKIDQLLAALEC